MYPRFINWISATPAASWLVRNFASRIDPVIFKATNGRFTSMGAPFMPMLSMTMIGRNSGKSRSVQLACIENKGDYLIVASAMGQQRHPSWRYNIEANPDVQVQMREDRFAARAEVLSDAEKDEVWDEIRQAIPQISVYEKRTDRNIRVFRLCRVDS